MKYIWNSCIAIFCCFAASSSYAQNSNVYHAKMNNWFFFHPTYQISEHWSMGTELHLRREAWVLHNRADLIRPYINYQLNESVIFTLGYTYLRSWPVEPIYGPGPSNEHNIWEQLSFKQALTGVNLTHRYRFEHRFKYHWDEVQGNYIHRGTDFANRFRYRISLDFPIPTEAGRPEFTIKLFDEIWINQYNSLMPESFARNWFYVGWNWKFLPKGSLELGYMHQYDNLKTDFLSTNIFQLSMAYEFGKL
jgi:hypothetical protein